MGYKMQLEGEFSKPNGAGNHTSFSCMGAGKPGIRSRNNRFLPGNTTFHPFLSVVQERLMYQSSHSKPLWRIERDENGFPFIA